MNTQDLAESIKDALMSPSTLPVPLRAVIAGTLMCARGGAPTRLGMATIGGYSYGSSQNHYSGLLDALVEQLPAAVASMAAGEFDPVAAAKVRADLQQRDGTLADLRRELAALTKRHENLRRYTLALHVQVRQLDEQRAAEGGSPVRQLRPLAWNPEPEPE